MNTDRFLYKGMTVNGEWVYGYLSVVTKEQKAKVEPGFYISNKMGMPFAYDVRPETVGQCTGVKDKNGKLIYEGDIVVGSWNTKLLVLWDDISVSFTVKPLSGGGERELHFFSNSRYLDDGTISYKDFEIIGNIHEMEKNK